MYNKHEPPSAVVDFSTFNSHMPTVAVPLGDRSYQIEIVADDLDRTGKILTQCSAATGPVSLAVVLTDVNVSKLGYAHQIAESISDSGIDSIVLSVLPGEQSKTIETAATLWKTLLEDGADRKSVLVSVGGGVIGDLGGFIAATYTRGIRFFQVPTTLLAQVDSSVGGKVGIDLPRAKNMIGAFHQPIGVLVDTKVLETLPEDQYLCGLGEVAKYGLSLDVDFLNFLEANAENIRRRDQDVLQRLVADCCRIKAQIVAEDEWETSGRRILLNYGHTFGHALEVMSDFKLLHGIAVALGSICAARLALRRGMIDEALFARHLDLLRSLGLPADLPTTIDWPRVVELMQFDKKTEFGRLNLVLPTGPGSCELCENVDIQQILSLAASAI